MRFGNANADLDHANVLVVTPYGGEGYEFRMATPSGNYYVVRLNRREAWGLVELISDIESARKALETGPEQVVGDLGVVDAND